jgi:hypothetical protein
MAVEMEDSVKKEVFGCFAFFCMSLYLLVRCHDSHHLRFKFLAPLHEIFNLKEMIDYVIHHLEAFLQSTGSQLRHVQACSVRLRKSDREKSEGPTPRCTNITTIIFPRISKTASRKRANEAGLLYFQRFQLKG